MYEKAETPPDRNVPAGTVDGDETSQMVVARVPQGYDTRIVVRLVPGRDIRVNPFDIGCQPRQGAPRRDAEAVPLPEDLVHKLRDANKRVVEWLAQDDANARHFMARPVEALLKAGVELTRADQKALERAHQTVRETAVIAPGVRVTRFGATAHPKGRVGGPKSAPPKSGDKHDGDCGCDSQGKE